MTSLDSNLFGLLFVGFFAFMTGATASRFAAKLKLQGWIALALIYLDFLLLAIVVYACVKAGVIPANLVPNSIPTMETAIWILLLAIFGLLRGLMVGHRLSLQEADERLASLEEDIRTLKRQIKQ